VLPRELIDAFGNLKVGETSHLVETSEGYHLLKRLPVPAETQIALAHLNIKYKGATGYLRPYSAVTRLRGEAEAIAKKLSLEALEHPANFAQLVVQHSDSDDALRAGDMGVWSRYEDTQPEALLFEASPLARNDPGVLAKNDPRLLTE
jgi:parvulin-like peptidyl-prolyl isomerase